MPNAIMHEGLVLRRAVVSPPKEEYFAVENLREHNIISLPNRKKAVEQHYILRKILRNQGVEVIEIPELKGHPNSVFTRDTSVSLGDAFIKLRMGLPTRRGEEEWMSSILEKLGLVKIGDVVRPGTAEGGDLIPAYPLFFIGISSRTNINGAKQIERVVENYGYETIKIKVPQPHLHLGGAMTVIGQDRILVCSHLTTPTLRDFEIIRVDCRTFVSGNVINIGKDRVIAEKRNAQVIEILGKMGYEVVPIDISEFVKGSGGPSCLILPLHRG